MYRRYTTSLSCIQNKTVVSSEFEQIILQLSMQYRTELPSSRQSVNWPILQLRQFCSYFAPRGNYHWFSPCVLCINSSLSGAGLLLCNLLAATMLVILQLVVKRSR